VKIGILARKTAVGVLALATPAFDAEATAP
jgi:hypothetical protein